MRNIIIVTIIVMFLYSLLPSVMAKDQDMYYAETTEVSEFNPIYTEDVISLRFTTLIFNSLVGEDPSLRLKPELLESLEPVSHDDLSYVFRLRKLRNQAGMEENIKWVGFNNDNEVCIIKDFTSEDVVYTFNAIKDSITPTMCEYVKKIFSDVRAVKGDDHLIEFVLSPDKKYMSEDINLILRHLKFPIIPYLPPGVEYDCAEIKGKQIIGTGPFIAAEDPGRMIKLVRNPYYFEVSSIEKDSKKLEIGNIYMTEYPDSFSAKEDLIFPNPKSLKIHLITELPLAYRRELNSLPIVTTARYATNRFNFFAYNCRGVFSDVKSRQAFTHATDRKEMFINIYGDIYPDLQDKPLSQIKEILHSPLPFSQAPSDITPLEYDVTKAKQLLNEARFARKKVTLLTYRGEPDEDRIYQMFRTYIKNNLDIEVEIQGVSTPEWKKRFESGDFDIAFGTWVFDEDVNIIQDLYSTSSPDNVVSYSNTKIESMLRRYDQSGRPEIRTELKHEMARIIAREVPYTFLFQLPKYTAYRSDVLRVVALHPYNFFGFVENWYMLKP